MPTMDDTPRQFIDELRLAIVRRRIGQIALAVVLAEECIRYLSAIVWYLVIPMIAGLLEGHTESVLFQSQRNRNFPWLQLFGSTLEFVAVIIFVFYVNRWLYGRNRPRRHPDEEEIRKEQAAEGRAPEQDSDDEPIVPRVLLPAEAPSRELVPSGTRPIENPSESA
jgi:large-conductance mechanosensitive channel